MATDQSPPQLRLILTIAAGAVVVLVSLKFVLQSYFTDIMEEAVASKFVDPDELNALHASETAKLNNGPAIPIDQAMSQLASQGRLGSTLIAPQPSEDTAALTGWAHLHDVDQPEDSDGGAAAPAMTASGATTTTTPPGPSPGFDGGASMMSSTGDAGA
ncbi:MAG: hypothetical protein ABI183_08730, partial [Polyangiaceae bacterium]